MDDPFRNEPPSESVKPSYPRWPAVRGLRRVLRASGLGVLWFLRRAPPAIWHMMVGLVRWSPFWVPRVVAYVFAPILAVIFGLRYAGGAYDRVELRRCEQGSSCVSLQDPVAPVDLSAMIWRRMRGRNWPEMDLKNEYEQGEGSIMILAGILWIYSLVWLVVLICCLAAAMAGLLRGLGALTV